MAQGSANTVFGKGGGSSKSRVKIPKFLRPLYRTGASSAVDSIQNLNSLMDPNAEFVADFSPLQDYARALGVDRALGGGDFIPTAQQTFLDAARGTDLSEYIPAESLSTLERLASGGGGVDPAVLERLQDMVDQGIEIPGMDRLAAIGGGVNDISRGALEATARGDYLYGGEGFDRAIDAAMNRIRPQLATTFGGAGPGAGTGALAQTAIAQAVADTFAGQYGQERGRQLGAAESLAGLDFTDRGQQADIASTLAQLGLAGTNTELGAADLLSSILSNQRDSELSAADRLAGIAETERTHQLNAAANLPGIATADIALLNELGAEEQAQRQAELDAPRMAQMQLLSQLLGIPFESLLGSNTSSRNWSFGQQFGVKGGFGMPTGGSS